MKKNYLIFSVLVFLPLMLLAQPKNDSTPVQWNYYKQRDLQKRLIQKEKPDSSKDDLQTKFDRWDWFWNNRHGNDGDMRSYTKAMSAVYQKKSSNILSASCQDDCNSSCFPADWRFIGPEYIAKQNLGQVHALWINPNDASNILGGAEGGLWKTSDGGLHWKNLTDFCLPGIGITTIAVQPNNTNIIYIGTGIGNNVQSSEHNYGDGIYKSIDGGITWQRLTVAALVPWENFCNKIIIHPLSSNLYAIIGSRAYKSVNAGSTWAQILGDLENPDRLALRDIELNPQVTASDEVYISSSTHIVDWNSCPTPSSNPCTYYCVGTIRLPTARIWKLGTHFNSTAVIPGSLQDLCATISGYTNDIAIAMLSLTANSINIATMNGNGVIKIFRKIGTGIWTSPTTSVSCPPGYYGFNSTYSFPFEVSPVNDNILYVGGNQLFKSVDGGNHLVCCWEYYAMNYGTNFLGSHPDLRTFILYQSFASGNDIIFLGNDGGIGKTVNGGQSTTNLNGANMQLTALYGISNNEKYPNAIFGGSQDNGIFNNTATTWKVDVIGDAYDAVADLNDPLVAYTTSNGSAVHKTTTGGGSWQSLGCPVGENCTYAPLWIDNQNRLYVGGKNLWRRNGASWVQITNLSNNRSIRSFKLTDDGNTGYMVYSGELWTTNPNAGFQNKVYKLTNLNTSPIATDITAFLEGVRYTSITDLAIDPLDGEKVWVCFGGVWTSNNKVFKYENNSWTAYGQNLPNIPANALEYMKNANDLLFIGTDDGVYYRNRLMTEWKPFRCNLPHAIVSDLEINYNANELRAATYGRGIWKTKIPIQYTSACSVPASVTTNLGNMSNGQTKLVTTFSQSVTINYGGTCVGGDCCTLPGGGITWTVYRRMIYPGTMAESVVSTGTGSIINFSGIFKTGQPNFPSQKFQYRVEIKLSCSGMDCATTTVTFRGQ